MRLFKVLSRVAGAPVTNSASQASGFTPRAGVNWRGEALGARRARLWLFQGHVVCSRCPWLWAGPTAGPLCAAPAVPGQRCLHPSISRTKMLRFLSLFRARQKNQL